jgi:hypothetical protein
MNMNALATIYAAQYAGQGTVMLYSAFSGGFGVALLLVAVIALLVLSDVL